MIATVRTGIVPGAWSGMDMGIIEVEAGSPGIISIGIRDRQGGTTRSMTTMDVGKSGDGRGHWMQRTAETRSDAEWGDTDCKALIATTLPALTMPLIQYRSSQARALTQCPPILSEAR